jgi:hypothetical protein
VEGSKTVPSLHHFLLVFDHSKGRLTSSEDFGTDSDSAVAAYAEKEIEFKDHDSIEIVLIGSDSLDTIRITHANYFDGTISVGNSKYLAGI